MCSMSKPREEQSPEASLNKDSAVNAETWQAKSPAPSPPSLPALLKVANMIKQITTKYSLPGQVKGALAEVADFARKAIELEENKDLPTVIILVTDFHEQLRSNLCHLYKALETKFTDLQAGQCKLLTLEETLSKTSENLQSSTKELEGKVDKVMDAMNRIANTTKSYCDALLAKPPGLHSPTAHPKVISDLERKDRQVLISYLSVKDNTTLGMSLLVLKDKANQILSDLDNPS
jgi:methyl-accepting chemotaxis protein